VDLLDNPKMITQFVGLERRTARSGRDSIDHAPNAHDDVCNAVAGVITNLSVRKYKYDGSLSWVSGPSTDDDEAAAHKADELRRVGALRHHMTKGA
jgi:hypothetical protein